MEIKGPGLRYTEEERDKWDRHARRKQRLKKEFEETPIELRKLFIQNFDVAPTEFEIQSFIYANLKVFGYPVRGEIRTVCSSCIFDIVIFAEHHPDADPIKIIEVKKKGEGGYWTSPREQTSRYSKYGIPVRIIWGPKEAREYIARVKQYGAAAL